MTTSAGDAQGSVDLADRSIDLGAWAENTPDAAEEFARAVRTWLADIQRLSPSVLVEDVNLRREDVGRDAVEATVRVSIVMKDAP